MPYAIIRLQARVIFALNIFKIFLTIDFIRGQFMSIFSHDILGGWLYSKSQIEFIGRRVLSFAWKVPADPVGRRLALGDSSAARLLGESNDLGCRRPGYATP